MRYVRMVSDKNVTAKLVALFEESEEELIDRWIERVEKLKLVSGLSEEERAKQFKYVYHASLMALKSEDYSEVKALASRIAKQGSLEGIPVNEILLSFMQLRDVRIRKLFMTYRDNLDELLDLLEHFEQISNKMFSIVVSALLKEQEKVIYEQQRAMLELSTPVLQLRDEALVMPLIGVIDSDRASRIVEELLRKIVETRASVVVMDMTGVPVIDTAVANHILKTVMAAKLLGAETIITGISPANAQTIVTLGIDLSMIKTKSTLQEGIKLMDEILGLEVRKGHKQ
ncbi:MAG: anti-anti-sigma regulatory factor (antagonist of anti-sigma factor) [Candidatus Syntrophoarchaeum caldarius]|uniref:Anti-anti-sigma regulatory factor (Antagonist of anti-sigma factor) n=1 Tax=Candidatus Syntropharchaeum caldarium TaxID=1838285 RepID=A0A1F2P8F0_9EURY|nr:MAG: anti-anti-sigma regulatory factor (antagonist of anti-sigma factor) [Candidatus Syntrophoarchaeum caldarius]